METVAYPGRDGAHSAAACDRLFPGAAELVPLPSFTAVVDAAAGGDVDFGVLPIESSLSGPVNETHDLLYDSPLSITGETVLITAGASAPEEVVQACVEALQRRFGGTVETRTVREEHVSFPLPRELRNLPMLPN